MRLQPRRDDDQWTKLLGLPSLIFTHAQVHALHAHITPGWREDAACASADPEAWFPTLGASPHPMVLNLCASCPVRRSCLAHALVVQEDGIWAGTTPTDRSTITDLLRTGTGVANALDRTLTPQGDPETAHSHEDTDETDEIEEAA